MALTAAQESGRETGGKRLTVEERMTIPALYVATGSKRKVAQALGVKETTVQRWIDNLSGEEWDRIQDEQRKMLLQKSTEILFLSLDLVPDKLATTGVRDILGAVKTVREAIAAWGGIGAPQHGGTESTSELESILAAAEAKRRQAAIEEALATGSMEPLKAFATVPSGS